MATTTVSDAVVVPQAQGTGLSSEADNVDAASAALLAEHVGGEYVGEGLTFTSHDGANDTVDVAAGYCFIEDDSSSTSGSRGSGGNPQIQSTSSSGYDTEIPNNQVYLVVFPTSVTIDLSDSTLNQVWVNITDVTSNNSVEIRSNGGGGTTSEPSDTFLKLGEANPDDSTADTRANDDPSPTFDTVTQDSLNLGSDGPATSFSDIVATGGNTATSDIGTDTHADALVYRTGGVTSGDVKGEVFRSGNTYSDSNDAGTVFQSVADDLFNRWSSNERSGKIAVAPGVYNFDSSAVFDDNDGLVIEGSAYRQSNNQSSTIFTVGSLSSGRGIFEFGTVGSGSGNDSRGCQVRGIYMDLGDNDVVGIYNWANDRLNLEHVKVINPGASGAGVAYLGSFNSTWSHCYFDQAVLVRNTGTNNSKDTNSTRIHDTTLNTNNASVSPFVYRGQGNRWTQVLVNSVDGPDLNTGVAVLSGDVSDTDIYSVDSRWSASDVDAVVRRTQFSSSLIVGAASNDDLLMKPVQGCQFSSCGFKGGRIENMTNTQFTGCDFSAQSTYFMKIDDAGGISQNSITGCRFFGYGQDADEPAIKFTGGRQTKGFTISNNSFRSNNSSTYDIVTDSFEGVSVTNNVVNAGISENNSSFLLGSSQNNAPKITNNVGYNPVGRSRSPPKTASNYTAGNFEGNDHRQPVWIWHDATSATITVEEFGSSNTLPISGQSPVRVPRFGQIKFGTSPSNWDWYWE